MIRLSYEQVLPDPWMQESPWTKLLLVDLAVQGRARFWKADLWHTVHLGMGKDFCASSLVLISQILPGSNVDLRFEALSQLYKQFCKHARLTKYINKIDTSTVGGAGKNDEPGASWNKAHVTANMLKFIQHLSNLYKEEFQQNERLQYIVSWFYLSACSERPGWLLRERERGKRERDGSCWWFSYSCAWLHLRHQRWRH